MRYRVVHRSSCVYAAPVEGAQHLTIARLRGFEGPWRTQRPVSHELAVEPDPERIDETRDAFGNHLARFELHRPHDRFTVTATGVADIATPPPPDAAALNDTAAWESVAADAAGRRDLPGQAVLEQALPSAFTPVGADLTAYARESFTPGRPVAAGALELARRIHDDFAYDPDATDLATPVSEVFAKRRGVCQDFAHLGLAMLRGLGLPARYVSGYVRTGNAAAPGLIGADASHAWLAVHLGGGAGGDDAGWFDVDPTNAKAAGEEHLTLAWGRDYADVSPLKGVLVGGGAHQVGVEVAVAALPPAAE